MEELSIENARIESTFLGREDHGILTFFLQLEYKGAGQGFGNYGLDTYEETKKRRIGTAFGMEAIAQVLQVVGVEKWEDLPGKYVRSEHNGTYIKRIGHITKDVWLDLKELSNSFYPEVKE